MFGHFLPEFFLWVFSLFHAFRLGMLGNFIVFQKLPFLMVHPLFVIGSSI